MGQVTHDPALRAALREVFAAELAERLPRLVAAGTPWDEDVQRDVHTLGSSAWVVGEPELARLARTCETTGEGLVDLVAVLQRWRP